MQPDNLPARGERKGPRHHLGATADSGRHLATASQARGSRGASISSTAHGQPSSAPECEADLGRSPTAAGRRGGTESHEARPQGGPGNIGLCLSLG